MACLYQATGDYGGEGEILNFLCIGVMGEWVSIGTIVDGLQEMINFATLHSDPEQYRAINNERRLLIANIRGELHNLMAKGLVRSKPCNES